MRRQFIWMQSALCAVTFSVAAPVLARADNGQPPPHAQAHGHDKDKSKDKKDKKDKDNQASQAHAKWDQRFHGLDRNRNDVLSRDEWNGDDRSFTVHDWNRDGVLSGDELIAGAKPNQNRAWDPRFNGLDRNRNDVVSRDEWNGDDRSFATHDWNRDGVLSGDELLAGAPNQNRGWDPRFDGLDHNRDNAVSRGEWIGDDRSFANHDWNRDGVLSGDELRAGATRPTASRLPSPPPPAPKAAPTPPKATRPRTESDEVLFARRDVNRDGRVSRDEWTGSASEFNRLDSNKDGVLSAYEYGVGR